MKDSLGKAICIFNIIIREALFHDIDSGTRILLMTLTFQSPHQKNLGCPSLSMIMGIC